MSHDKKLGTAIAGAVAGLVNGLFGAGGGMVLVPALTKCTDLRDEEVFPASVSIILPICLVSLGFTLAGENQQLEGLIPYLIGSALGGIAAGFFGRKLPILWLHRCLGVLILWGGVRYLC